MWYAFQILVMGGFIYICTEEIETKASIPQLVLFAWLLAWGLTWVLSRSFRLLGSGYRWLTGNHTPR